MHVSFPLFAARAAGTDAGGDPGMCPQLASESFLLYLIAALISLVLAPKKVKTLPHRASQRLIGIRVFGLRAGVLSRASQQKASSKKRSKPTRITDEGTTPGTTLRTR